MEYASRADDDGDLASCVKHDTADAENGGAGGVERDERLLAAAVEFEQASAQLAVEADQVAHAQPHILGSEAPEKAAIGGPIAQA